MRAALAPPAASAWSSSSSWSHRASRDGSAPPSRGRARPSLGPGRVQVLVTPAGSGSGAGRLGERIDDDDDYDDDYDIGGAPE